MTEGQKIALEVPESAHPDNDIQSSAKIDPAHHSTKPVRRRGGRGARIIRSFRFLLDCLAIGSQTVGLADNSQLLRDLSARARLLYGLDEC